MKTKIPTLSKYGLRVTTDTQLYKKGPSADKTGQEVPAYLRLPDKVLFILFLFRSYLLEKKKS